MKPRLAWHFVFSFLFMAAIWQIDGLRSNGGWRSADKPAKFLAVLPCLFFLLRFPPRQGLLWAGIGCGAIGSGVMAIYQCFWLRLPRAEGEINAIQFGNLSLLLGLMCVVGLMVLRPARFKRAWMAVMGAGVLLGVLGSLLSQSRGGWLAGWLALVLFLLVLVTILWRFLDRRYLAISAGIAMLCGAALLSLMAEKLIVRLDEARHEIAIYETTGNAATSVGQRLDHWKLALRLGLSRPLAGWSQKGYEREKGRLVATGQAHPFLLQFGHAHNEFLDLFAKRGILGLGALLYLYAVPLVLFWPRRAAAPPPSTTVALQVIGVLIPLAYAGCGLTQGFLGHNSGTMFFVFMTTLIFARYRASATSPESMRVNLKNEVRSLQLGALCLKVGGAGGVDAKPTGEQCRKCHEAPHWRHAGVRVAPTPAIGGAVENTRGQKFPTVTAPWRRT